MTQVNKHLDIFVCVLNIDKLVIIIFSPVEDSRFAEASRRVYLSLIVWRVRVVQMFNGYRNLLSHKKNMHFCGSHVGVQTFLERLSNAELRHFDHLQ